MRKLRQDEVVSLKSLSMVAAEGVRSPSPPRHQASVCRAGSAALPWFPGTAPEPGVGDCVREEQQWPPLSQSHQTGSGLVCVTQAPGTASPVQALAETLSGTAQAQKTILQTPPAVLPLVYLEPCLEGCEVARATSSPL